MDVELQIPTMRPSSSKDLARAMTKAGGLSWGCLCSRCLLTCQHRLHERYILMLLMKSCYSHSSGITVVLVSPWYMYF